MDTYGGYVDAGIVRMNKNEIFATAKWIWFEEKNSVDSYGEFVGEFPFGGDDTYCRISCDSDYALYVNGEFVDSNQYADFERYKIYDTLNLTPYLKKGKNRIAIVVWYFGESSQKYSKASAGLIFSVYTKHQTLLVSNDEILARKSKAYHSGRKQRISAQLGFSFFYDASQEDDWQKVGGSTNDFKPAVICEKTVVFYSRPNKKLRLLHEKRVKRMRKNHDNRTLLIDLGEETVGLPVLRFYSPNEQVVQMLFGERLIGDNVARFLGGNDYSFLYKAKKGINEYVNPFLRLGCRYLQIISEEKVDVHYVGIKPQTYPVKTKQYAFKEKIDEDIFKLCVKTLRLCMLEHYVDCPFREQGLYAYDARNQMLAGYFAFGGRGYRKYALSNLLLFAQDGRKDGLLSITTPCDSPLVIPTYSLFYIIAVAEYLRYTKAKALPKSILLKIKEITKHFSAHYQGLITSFKGDGAWNFYDWSTYLNGYDRKFDGRADLVINCLYVLAIESCKTIENYLKISIPYTNIDLIKLRRNTYKRFFCEEKGLFGLYDRKDRFTKLGNSLAVLAKIVVGKEAENVCKKMQAGQTTECTLSMKPFYYDALLATDKIAYTQAVKEDIRKQYGEMIRKGATASWETETADEHFGMSLCHGWSAIPIYYYSNYFQNEMEKEKTE